MKYLGGKHQIGEKISNFIVKDSKKTTFDTYLEPFCGSLGVFKHMTNKGFKKCIASDIQPDIIKLWNEVKMEKLKIPSKISEKKYHEYKKLISPNSLKAIAGFGLSYGGKYFSGYSFPLDLTKSLKNLIFFEFNHVQKTLKKDLLIESVFLNHPGGAVGYSIKCNDTKISILLDNEYKNSQFNNLYNFVSGSNLVLWDGMFTNEDLQTKGIWGHSSIEQGVEFSNQCNVNNMLVTHHDPLRSDEQLDTLAKELPSGINFAKDGMTFNFT